MKTKIILLSIILGAMFTQVNAQNSTLAERKRIGQGVKSGELTKAETANLARGQRAIRKEKKAARADGVVTKQERKEIRKDKKQQSRKIARKKHNKRDRN
jgi:hypothetical protein